MSRKYKFYNKEFPYCVHLNRKEVISYTEANTLEEALHKMSSVCKVSAITDGEKGLYYKVDDTTLHGLSKIDEVYSTIGSGDCLLAGIVAGHINQLENQEIVELGAACGAANCIRPELGMLHKKDVERLIK